MKPFTFLTAAVLAFAAPLFGSDVLYSSIPTPLPPDGPGFGFQSGQLSELGQQVTRIGGDGTTLSAADIMFSSSALASSFPSLPADGFDIPMILNIYDALPNNAAGILIATDQVTAHIQFRPPADPSCGSGWKAANDNCYNGFAQLVTFHFDNVIVPTTFIWGVAFNTNTYGYDPIGAPGPYDSLTVATSARPTLGSDLDGAIYASSNSSPGALELIPTGYRGYDPAATFYGTATPEPRTLIVLGASMVAIGLWGRGKQR